jgi:ADP-ribosylation factor protein 6
MINDEELKDAVILVYANKQDLAGVMSIPYITEKLKLH